MTSSLLEGPGLSPPRPPSSPPAAAASSGETSFSFSAPPSFPLFRSSQTKSVPARPPPTSRADQTAPMAERPQLRETTATRTGAQVTQAEPHLPRPLQPFTVPVGWRISAEPSPPRLTLNFAGPAPRRSPGLQPQAPAPPDWSALLYQHFPLPTPRVAGGRGHWVPGSTCVPHA